MAGRLARAGYAVTLLEKNAGVGGRMQSYNPPVRTATQFACKKRFCGSGRCAPARDPTPRGRPCGAVARGAAPRAARARHDAAAPARRSAAQRALARNASGAESRPTLFSFALARSRGARCSLRRRRTDTGSTPAPPCCSSRTSTGSASRRSGRTSQTMWRSCGCAGSARARAPRATKREGLAAALTACARPLRQVSPAYRAHFGDGTTFDLSYDMARTTHTLALAHTLSSAHCASSVSRPLLRRRTRAS
jgi:hypothetical protein